MLERLTLCSIAACLTLTLSGPVAGASASSHQINALRVLPARVAINGPATVMGAHLQAHTFYSILFASPDLRKNAVRQFIGVAKTDSSGDFRLYVKRMPIVVHCGRAGVYALTARSSKIIGAHITMTGCTLSKPGKIPPPPLPGHHKP